MLVTVITVCRNSEITIQDTIESVLNQSFTDYEYIIVDGGSTDSTINIIERYSPLFCGKLRWVSEPDKGIYDAMNKGIGMATGELIGILNSDDWYEPDALEKVTNSYKELNAGLSIISGGINLTRFNKQSIQTYFNKDVGTNIKNCMPINHPAMFVPKIIYEKIGLYDIAYKLSGDYEFVFRAYNNGVNFVLLNSVLTNMRMGGATIGHGLKGLDNGFIISKEDYLIKLKHTGEKKIAKYCWQIFILKMRQIKRIFVPSKYDT